MVTKKSPKKPGQSVVSTLTAVLSDTYVLAVKTHGYHWNVTGPLFPQLHSLFGTQYEALFEAADDIAERIRALDKPAPGSMNDFLGSTVLKEAAGQKLSAEDMVGDLLKSHEKLRERLSEAGNAAAAAGDKATEDLMIQRMQYHDKTMWMLRAQLD